MLRPIQPSFPAAYAAGQAPQPQHVSLQTVPRITPSSTPMPHPTATLFFSGIPTGTLNSGPLPETLPLPVAITAIITGTDTGPLPETSVPTDTSSIVTPTFTPTTTPSPTGTDTGPLPEPITSTPVPSTESPEASSSPATLTSQPLRSTPTPIRIGTPSPRVTRPLATPPRSTPLRWWIGAKEGGRREFGAILAIVPPGFTNQNGANVIGDLIISSTTITYSDQLIVGTEFAFAIWPKIDQVEYQKPIEFRVTLDAAQVTPGTEEQLIFMMYNPDMKQWEVLPSEFHQETFQIIAFVKLFRPLPQNFPKWGKGTIFGVFKQKLDIKTGPHTGHVNHDANLHAGPGYSYPKVGNAKKGQSFNLIEKTANGRWFRLDNGGWIPALVIDNISALPIATTTPTIQPLPVSKPRATATP